MKLSHLLELLHTMEPDATVCVSATGTDRHGKTVKYDIRITHAEQIGAGTQAVVRLEAEDDLCLD
jgi:hypothetical protein